MAEHMGLKQLIRLSQLLALRLPDTEQNVQMIEKLNGLIERIQSDPQYDQ